MFSLFSTRLGCLKSIIISVIATVVLLLLLGVVEIPRSW